MSDKDRLLSLIQPLVLGLCDGTISTLAPLYTLSFLVDDPMVVFYTVAATSIGAAVSMGISEGLSDDGALTGRGHPLRRGLVTGGGTFVGAFMHALPFLVPHMTTAVILASFVVTFELFAIAFIRWKYFPNTTLIRSLMQITLGGVVVVAVGVAIGGA